MNSVAITGLLGKALPILKMLGVDPAKIVNQYGRTQVTAMFKAAASKVVSRLETDGLTPTAKGDSPEAERLVIRAAMYLIAKEALKNRLPKGANLVADHLRDAADDKIVKLVSPQIDASTTTAAMVDIIIGEWVELLF